MTLRAQTAQQHILTLSNVTFITKLRPPSRKAAPEPTSVIHSARNDAGDHRAAYNKGRYCHS